MFRADPSRACVLVVVLCDGSCGGRFRARISRRRHPERGSSGPTGQQRCRARSVYDNVKPVARSPRTSTARGSKPQWREIYEEARRDLAAAPTDRTNSQGGVKLVLAGLGQDEAAERRGGSGRPRPRTRRRAVARGADPLAHPVDRGAELGRRRGAGRTDLERRQGTRIGLGRRAAGARVRQDPGAARERNRPAAEPDPSLHQPAEPRTVRRDTAAARGGAGHADDARLHRPDAVGLGGGTRARHRALPRRLRRIARRPGHHLEDL